MTKAERSPVKKTRLEEYIAKHDLELPEKTICKIVHNHYGYGCFEFVGEE